MVCRLLQSPEYRRWSRTKRLSTLLRRIALGVLLLFSVGLILYKADLGPHAWQQVLAKAHTLPGIGPYVSSGHGSVHSTKTDSAEQETADRKPSHVAPPVEARAEETATLAPSAATSPSATTEPPLEAVWLATAELLKAEGSLQSLRKQAHAEESVPHAVDVSQLMLEQAARCSAHQQAAREHAEAER